MQKATEHEKEVSNLVRFQGKHIQNDSDTLIVVFQGAFTKFKEEYITKIFTGIIPQKEVEKTHQYYHFMKLSQTFKTVDFFYLEDYYNGLYGWYLMENGRFIFNEISDCLTAFIQRYNYKRVLLMGSSKGGVGAILVGLTSPLIDEVFCMVPDLRISTEMLGEHANFNFFKGNSEFEDKVKNLFKNDQIFSVLKNKQKETRFTFLTGVRDHGFGDLANFTMKLTKQKNIHSKMYIIPTPELHNALIKNHTGLIYEIINTYIQKSSEIDPSLVIKVDHSTYIITYKGVGLQLGKALIL